ncbi:uncharacterized protein C8R40DRAFT_1168513 [Lentinula edodes]|uniref:uncharacterized protein n=1 Tax=Lentinula edodes TaxID=5353 RepID=UPI001E8CAE8A|nr:uncharacterized protein C8R40DRAFT_1168513 [Lentinula edodes]KAH7877177.1 hypothetical protein C8R40DRAFT_1168513 [Lentinula edodes]
MSLRSQHGSWETALYLSPLPTIPSQPSLGCSITLPLLLSNLFNSLDDEGLDGYHVDGAEIEEDLEDKSKDDKGSQEYEDHEGGHEDEDVSQNGNGQLEHGVSDVEGESVEDECHVFGRSESTDGIEDENTNQAEVFISSPASGGYFVSHAVQGSNDDVSLITHNIIFITAKAEDKDFADIVRSTILDKVEESYPDLKSPDTA